MQNVSRDCHRRVLPGKRHSGRTLYAKAQSEPYAREENTTAAALPATFKKQSAPAILSRMPVPSQFRPLRAGLEKMIVDVHAASPNSERTPCMARLMVWEWV